jgi:leucyl aminopeptidase (aminopeptidase T)
VVPPLPEGEADLLARGHTVRLRHFNGADLTFGRAGRSPLTAAGKVTPNRWRPASTT